MVRRSAGYFPSRPRHCYTLDSTPSTANGGQLGISTYLTTWTIHLRPVLKWSDGTPLTAADCAFSFNVFANPAYGANGFPTTDPADPIGFEDATVVDNQTVVLKIKHPYAGMLVCSPTVLVRACQRRYSRRPIQQILVRQPSTSSRPSQVVPSRSRNASAGDHITVVRNPYYYQGPDKPYLDQITFKLLTGTDAGLSALKTSAVDTIWNLDFHQLASYRSIPGYTTFLDRYPSAYEALIFNLSDPLTGDPAIR